MKTVILALVTGLLIISTSWAQSEVDFRYIIRGYVLDDNKQGIKNQHVRVYRGRVLVDMVNTDSDGFYTLKLNLRNADNQQKFKLRAGTDEADISISFDKEAPVKSRIHEANFVAGKLVEGRLSQYLIPPWIYPIGGLLMIGFVAVKLEKRRKKKIQQKKDKLSGRESTKNHHAKKRQRRKH